VKARSCSYWHKQVKKYVVLLPVYFLSRYSEEKPSIKKLKYFIYGNKIAIFFFPFPTALCSKSNLQIKKIRRSEDNELSSHFAKER